jgi:cysteinyl-tRNA synthetase
VEEAPRLSAGPTAIPGHDRACRAFKEDLSHLNMLEPTMWRWATDHIPEQIEAIQCIEAKGLTYRTADAIYFDTSNQRAGQ